MKKYLSLNSAAFDKYQAKSVSELWQKAQRAGYEALCATCSIELTVEGEAETKKFHAVFSSNTQDRHGDVVHQNFDLKAFKKNPVFLDSHDYSSIEHILGRIEPIGIKDGKLQGDIVFATMNPKGMLAQQMAEAGFLNTTSIGFIPKEFDESGNPTKSELLEVSGVSVPANPDALFEKEYDEPQAEPDAEPTEPAPVVTQQRANPRKAALEAINDYKELQHRHLKVIAREVQKMRDPQMQKRKVYQSIRALLKDTDNAA